MTGTAKLSVSLIVALLAAAPGTAGANAFVAWKVAGVPWNDTLTVRKFPSSTSRKRGALPNGAQLSMTGRCTGGVDLRMLAGRPAAEQKRSMRRQWCEIWHDPAGNARYETGWVYGRFIDPAF